MKYLQDKTVIILSIGLMIISSLIIPEPAMARSLPEIFQTLQDWGLALVGSIFIVLFALGALISARKHNYPELVLSLLSAFFLAYVIFAPKSATAFFKSVGLDLFG
jgi:hypothetical protein